MKYIQITIFLIIGNLAFANSITLSGTITDFNQSPINNHKVLININDTSTQYSNIDSVYTDNLGHYTFSHSHTSITQSCTADIIVWDCTNTSHLLSTSATGGNNLNFQICSNALPPCHAQFIVAQDTLNPMLYHFTNQTTPLNFTSTWLINGNIVGTQTNLDYTFSTNPAVYTISLIINSIQPPCSDTTDTLLTVNNCSIGFTTIINGLTATFNASGTPTANLYSWKFGDGSSQSTTQASINHSYASAGAYNIKLTSYTIYNQDTCIANSDTTISIQNSGPTGQFFGYVFTDTTYLEKGKILIYKKNISNQKLSLIKTSLLQYDSSNANWYYLSDNLPYGDYYIKCEISYNSPAYGVYFDTWAAQSPNKQIVNWKEAEAQTITTNKQLANINLKKPDISFTAGNRSISGIILETMGVSALNQTLYLLNKDKLFIRNVYPSAATGTFQFDSLINGTYFLRPELVNYNSFDYKVILSTSNPSANGIKILIDSTHYFTSIDNKKPLSYINSFKIFPNPVQSNLRIEISTIKTSSISISITDAIGRNIFTIKKDITSKEEIIIPMNEKKSGLYFISISDGYTIISKKIIKQ